MMKVLRTMTAFLMVVAVLLTGWNGAGNVEAATPAIAKTPGNSNPLITHELGADPYALVYNDRVYVYMTGDVYVYDNNGNVVENDYGSIRTINVISSDDMVNWTDHGAIPVAGSGGIASWAANSWAPAIAHKVINGKDKFFLYFANNGSGIGVLTADSPIGPWTDPIGRPLISWSTPGVQGVVWLFDPAVLVDDNGNGYLYFGGGIPGNGSQSDFANPKTARVIRLTNDMIGTQGSAQVIDAPFMFESSGIHKYNGKYYYSYCSNFGGNRPPGAPPAGEIAYMVSDNPMGPFTYVKSILRNPGYFFGIGGNNHHAIFQFRNQWYIAYHAQTVSTAELGTSRGYRSTHINKLEHDRNGEIIPVQANMQGVAQLKNLNPYVRTEAETIGWQGGIRTEAAQSPGSMVPSVNRSVAYIEDGDWIAVGKADFGSTGATSFKANVASPNGGQIEIRLGSTTGQVVGRLDVSATGGWQTWRLEETSINRVTGVHDVYFMFKGSSGYLFNVDYWQFSSASGVGLAAPTNLTATAGNASISLSWTASSGASSYTVKRATSSGGPYTTVAANVTSTSFTDTGLTNGTTYYYVVSAANSGGESANSSQASATPQSSGSGPTYEAETAGLTDSIVESLHSGYTGTGYVNFNALSGAAIQWNDINVATTGTKDVKFRYALESGTRHLDIYVNGIKVISDAPFTATGSWAAWGEKTIQVPMNTGTNTLRVVTTGTEGPNMDSIHVTAGSTSIPSGDLELQYKAANTVPGDGQISPHFRIVNNGSSAVNLSDLKIRYWYTINGEQPQSFHCDYAIVGCTNISGQFAKLSTARPRADHYMEVSFASGAGSIAPGSNSGDIQTRFNKNNWSNYDESDDYSFDSTKTSYVNWDRVTLYQNGTLVWGMEP